MITKERLEELINQASTIYYVADKVKKNIWEIHLKNDSHDFIAENKVLSEVHEGMGLYCRSYALDKLFETKEEAEWYADFGCITKRVKLSLPSWGKVRKNGCDITFLGYDYFGDFMIYRLLVEPDKRIFLGESSVLDNYSGFAFLGCFNKDSYLEACRMCKTYFLRRVT